jgi:hypothetical protein
LCRIETKGRAVTELERNLVWRQVCDSRNLKEGMFLAGYTVQDQDEEPFRNLENKTGRKQNINAGSVTDRGELMKISGRPRKEVRIKYECGPGT